MGLKTLVYGTLVVKILVWFGFSDADYAGYKVDRKSTLGSRPGNSLISWYYKKQNSVALSTAEAEYKAAGACCSQVLCIAQQLRELGVDL